MTLLEYVELHEAELAAMRAERANARSLACALEAENARLTEALETIELVADGASKANLDRIWLLARQALAPVHDLLGDEQ